MEPVEELLTQPRVIQAILAHMAKHPEPLTGRELEERMDYNRKDTGTLRHKLERAGILQISSEDIGLGRIPMSLSRLTPEGVKAGQHLLAASEEIAKAQKRKSREESH